MVYNIVTNPVAVKQFLINSDEDMLREYAESDPELTHVLDFAITDHNNRFFAGASACCGFQYNSRGTNFTLLPNALFVEFEQQGQGYGRKLIEVIADKAMALFAQRHPTNELLIDCAFGSTEGAHCCYKLYQLIKAKLAHTKTKVLFHVCEFGMVVDLDDLKTAIERNPFCD